MKIKFFACLFSAALLISLALANPPSYLTQKMIDNHYGVSYSQENDLSIKTVETIEETASSCSDLLRQFAGETRLQYLLRRDGLVASMLVGKIVEHEPLLSDKQAYNRAWQTARENRDALHITIHTETVELAPSEEELFTETRLENILRLDGQVASDISTTISKWGQHLSEMQVYDIARNIARYSRMHNLRPDVVVALIRVESDYHINCSSRTNDHGLMQVHGKRVFGIEENIAHGTDELGWRVKGKNGDYRAALAGYNGGTYPPPVSWRYAERVLGLAAQVL